MNIHEYQAKEILREYKIAIPDFEIVKSHIEVSDALMRLGVDEAVLKVQVHAGGRGKAGGVKIVKGKEAIVDEVKNLIGLKVVNEQTGKDGLVSQCVMISKLSSIKKEYYLGAIVDRKRAESVLIASQEGGMDIETVAATMPEKILTLPIGLDGKMRGYHLFQLAKFMNWKGGLAKQGMHMASLLAKAFVETDASLLEINPLVETEEGELIALDAKLSVDDNALFRQKKIASFYDKTQVSKKESEAKEYDLSYIALEGEIGCMVNGAGLAMATMDIISHFGGRPANFLDVGGSASAEKVAEGFRLILSDPNVQVVLINIFGGIMNCSTMAEGILQAAKTVSISVPLVVRLEGTEVEEGKKKLKQSDLTIITADSLKEAAEKSVEALRGHSH